MLLLRTSLGCSHSDSDTSFNLHHYSMRICSMQPPSTIWNACLSRFKVRKSYWPLPVWCFTCQQKLILSQFENKENRGLLIGFNFLESSMMKRLAKIKYNGWFWSNYTSLVDCKYICTCEIITPRKVVFFEIFLNWFKCNNYSLYICSVCIAFFSLHYVWQKRTLNSWENNDIRFSLTYLLIISE